MASRFSIQRLTVSSFSHLVVVSIAGSATVPLVKTLPRRAGFTPVRSNSIVERVADVVDVTGDNDQQRRLSRGNNFPAPPARKFSRVVECA
jgi:hypothetical protein